MFFKLKKINSLYVFVELMLPNDMYSNVEEYRFKKCQTLGFSDAKLQLPPNKFLG